MLSHEITRLENENHVLKEQLKELSKKMEQNEVSKPKSCQYCKHYVQYYIKGGAGFIHEYTPIYKGHCTRGVPIYKGGKKKTTPEDTCPFFELGTHETKHLV